MTLHRYTISSTRASSHKYGPCSVCDKHASEVFRQTEEREYDPANGAPKDYAEDAAAYKGGDLGWTHEGCRSLLGHMECLESVRREPCQIVVRGLPVEGIDADR